MDSPNENIIVCQVCGHRNLKGTLICENCSAMLTTDNQRGGTRNLRDELPEFQTNPVFSKDSTGTFAEGTRLRLDIVGQDARIEVQLSHQGLIVGRRDPTARQRPDIDMEDYEGYRLGVSRKHASFSADADELTLQDYGSANGTFLNGVRLPSHQPHKIHDGDVIRFGHLTARVYFLR